MLTPIESHSNEDPSVPYDNWITGITWQRPFLLAIPVILYLVCSIVESLIFNRRIVAISCETHDSIVRRLVGMPPIQRNRIKRETIIILFTEVLNDVEAKLFKATK